MATYIAAGVHYDHRPIHVQMVIVTLTSNFALILYAPPPFLPLGKPTPQAPSRETAHAAAPPPQPTRKLRIPLIPIAPR